jgi:hypothetical protein
VSAGWAAILLAAVGCFAWKVAGLTVPREVLDRPVVRRLAFTLPIGLLAALTAVQAFAAPGPDGGVVLQIDARAAGLVAGVVALVLRAPFLVVVLVAAVTTAAARAIA